MTAGVGAHSIGYVHLSVGRNAGQPAEQLLTKRRAVDFCRVATALCRMAPSGESVTAAR